MLPARDTVGMSHARCPARQRPADVVQLHVRVEGHMLGNTIEFVRNLIRFPAVKKCFKNRFKI